MLGRRLLLWMACVVTLVGQVVQAPEYQLKAAYLYNFSAFITWPQRSFPSPTAPFVIGVLGDDPFDSALHTAFKEKRFNGRPYEVRQLRDLAGAEECQLLFLSRTDSKRATAVVEALREKPVLTVADFPGFAASGGVINFFAADDKVRFEINPGAAEKAGLKIHSQLLRLATVSGAQAKR